MADDAALHSGGNEVATMDSQMDEAGSVNKQGNAPDSSEAASSRGDRQGWLAEQAGLLEFAHDAVRVEDLSGRVVYWNRAAEQVYGWPAREAVGRLARELFAEVPPELDQARNQVLAEGDWGGELHLRGRRPDEVIVRSRWTLLRDASGAPQGILVIETDVTEKKRLEAHLLRAQRLEGLGVLAGGISHDLNNILAPILMSVGMLRQTVPDDESRQLVDAIETSAKRCADLVRHLLAFSRGSEGERLVFRPEHVVREVARIVQETFPPFIRFRWRIEDALWPLSGNPTHLEQVLLNLCLNARDAMPEGGELVLEVRNASIDAEAAQRIAGLKPGPYLVFRVKDTGCGMSPEVLERIFEPFYTTKPAGQGTGLGLATVLSIVQGYGGAVEVHSEVGRGSCFEVYLPASPQTEAAPAPSPAKPPVPRGKGELVLAVDDEPSILEVTRETLVHHGYRVLAAEDGLRGLTMFLQHQTEVKLVLADIAMPNMDGLAMVRAMRRIDPHLTIVVSTGLGLDTPFGDWPAIVRELQVRHILTKPYKANELLELVDQALHRDS